MCENRTLFEIQTTISHCDFIVSLHCCVVIEITFLTLHLIINLITKIWCVLNFSIWIEWKKERKNIDKPSWTLKFLNCLFSGFKFFMWRYLSFENSLYMGKLTVTHLQCEKNQNRFILWYSTNSTQRKDFLTLSMVCNFSLSLDRQRRFI